MERMRVRARLLVLCASLALAALALRGTATPKSEGDYTTSLLAALEARGMRVEAADLVWMREPRGLFSLTPVYFLARPVGAEGELPDLYYADVRSVAPGGVLDVWFLTNLTRSSAAAEGPLLRVGDHLAYAVRVGDVFDAIMVLDTRGESTDLTAGWSRLKRLQNAVTNLQETGRAAGVGRRRLSLMPPAETLALAVRQGQLVAVADGERIAIDPERGEIESGRHRVQPRVAAKGRPGLVTWVVDTVRNLSFVGPEPIEWLEHTVFGLTDRANRAYHGVVGTDTEAEVRAALGVAALADVPVAGPSHVSALPDIGHSETPRRNWPPRPLLPVLSEPVRGEGRWLPLENDPFINRYDHAPAAFLQTFIRVDPEREFARVYITLWDPHQVQLHLAMGTREPESATGETGTGRIPDDPELVARLVGAFNGGFQALHGEFGMMADGRVYLPPKPFAATVAVYDDGGVAMGSWPGPGQNAWDEEFANSQIPTGMVAMRQNLTSVVEDQVWNPWKRWWWGAAPTWAKEQTYIHRSGLCLTEDGYLAYFWGESMGPEALGKAMVATRCVRGMHLDMNSKHTGMEFYRPQRTTARMPGSDRSAGRNARTAPVPTRAPAPLGRPLTKAEFEGPVEGREGFVFRARKAVTTMTPLRFPRYLEEDPRDFFYLSIKPILPGPELRFGTQSLPFSTRGLPSSGWPHPFARARIATSDGVGTWFVRIDPNRLRVPASTHPPMPPQATGHPSEAGDPPGDRSSQTSPLAFLTDHAAQTGPLALYLPRSHGRRRPQIVAASEVAEGGEVWLRGRALAATDGAGAAIGVDADGFLLYAEMRGVPKLEGLRGWLARAGVHRAIALSASARLSFVTRDGKTVAVDGRTERIFARAQALALSGDTRPPAKVLHPDVKPRPYRLWGWLQGTRVRYFPTGEPRFKAPDPTPAPN